MSQPKVEVLELDRTLYINSKTSSQETIRSFSLSTQGICVELCSVGASITKFMVPSYDDGSSSQDDVVLGYNTPVSMLASGNPPYFGVIVGRVANRIAKGMFQLADKDKATRTYKLATNNGPNHLHGGSHGFGHCIWDAEIVNIDNGKKGVRFSLMSNDGDQGYPGTIHVTATYSLVPKKTKGATLRLDMMAQLCDDGKVTPINLAQHSYFNLAGHDDSQGVLNHHLVLPSQAYTPTDKTSVPTREVRLVAEDAAMDWRGGRLVRDALISYGTAKAGLSKGEATQNVSRSPPNHVAKAGNDSLTPGEPYGFDHNYVIEQKNNEELNLAGIMQHEPTKRQLSVWTDAPGVQLYTANYLDGGISLDPKMCKSNATYGQWQGLCLETQHYPDSILLKEDLAMYPEFSKGKCPILRPDAPIYSHTLEHHVEPMSS